MCSRKLILLGISATVFLIALLTGPSSFDATDGAEFAVCGGELQIAHAPGYPLFLMLVRFFSMIFSPVYGHLRLLNCFLAAAVVWMGTAAFQRSGTGFLPALAGSLLFLTSAPVMSQFNSLEIYPLAILLVLTAMYLKDSALSPYASGMALFAGHPVSLLSSPLFFSFKRKWPLILTFLIPATLYLYIPIRSGASRIAHYGHPASLETLFNYFTMYSGRLGTPSFNNLSLALSSIGIPALVVFVLLATAGGRFSFRRDIPIIASLIFLASYELPDPAGQLWILLLPLSLRCSTGIEKLFVKKAAHRILAAGLILIAIVSGIAGADRTGDDIAMRWTTDVMSSLPAGSVYRPVAHDTYYAAYAQTVLGFRQDVLLSDPFGNYFEYSPPGPVPSSLGGRTVHISRAWNREESFSLQGLVFSPINFREEPLNWEQMDIFKFQNRSPDPMAMDIIAEAWARRMLQEESPSLRDSFYLRAVEFSATPVTRRRIENIKENI
ncbi:MAG: DUF2723 domain-containing protein [Candidatus Sabulitectum sp.]|nr:DUF2723 domain-containing protein [Candidatus Sabulitectum sp.]